MKVLSFSGTPAEIGAAFGESCRADIATLYRRRVDNALAQAREYGGRVVTEDTLLAVSRGCLPASEAYDPDGLSELAGIARGANLSVEQIFAMNGLTDLRDVLAFGDMADWPVRPEPEDGCSSFVLPAGATREGRTLAGQTWDLATDNMPFVCVVHRRPLGRPETWSMTTVGCLSLIGLNADGIAIGTTNVRTTDSRLGVSYLQIIHKALGLSGLDAVERAIVEAPRAGAHYYYAVGPDGAAIAVECTATESVTTRVADGAFIHTNHILDAGQRRFEARTPMTSSHCRQARLSALLRGRAASLDDVKAALADHDGAENAICRHDFGGISSNGSVIMDAAARRLWVCHGPACTGSWFEATARGTAPEPR